MVAYQLKNLIVINHTITFINLLLAIVNTHF